MEKRFLAWLIAICLFLGCLDQLSEEQKAVKDYNLSEKAAGCLDGDGKLSEEEARYIKGIESMPNDFQDKLATAYNCDMVKIGAVAAYKDKPFFDAMMNTDSLKFFDTYVEINNSDPLLAEQVAKEGGPNTVYTRAREAGLGTLPAYVLSHKQLGPDESNIFKYIASFDTQAQTEAAKAYGDNLEFNELEFFAKDPYGANKVLQGGYSDTKDKYVEEVMKSFSANLSKYLFTGAINDDGSLNQKDYDKLQWFKTEYDRMSPAMRNYFIKITNPDIGDVTGVTITDSSVSIPDPRAVASALEDAKYIIPPGKTLDDYKIVVDIENPGDYIKEGERYIAIKGDSKNQLGQLGRFTLRNLTRERIWVYNDKLITTDALDHIKYEVDGKWWITSQEHPFYGKPGGLYGSLYGKYDYNIKDLIDIGYDSLIEIAEEGHHTSNDISLENPGLYI